MYNITSRRSGETTVAVEVSHILSVYLYSWLSNMQNECTVLYYLLSVWLSYTFPRYFINGTIFGKKLQHKICIWIFCTNFVWNIYHL